MLTMARPLPPTPYTGPIYSPRRPLPVTPPTRTPASTQTSTPNTAPSPILKRRPHTRRVAPSNILPAVSEEEEVEVEVKCVEDDKPASSKPKRPRPTPLIPSRKYAAPALPLIVEIPDSTPTSIQPALTELETFALSPSTLLARRRSETILDFPLPPASALPAPPLRHSPTPSHASTSTASSAPYPRTPHASDTEEDWPAPSEKMVADDFIDLRSPRPVYRSASVLSLRSFSTAEFDTQAEGIYALMHPKRDDEPVVEKKAVVPAPAHGGGRSPRLVLSVMDTASGGSFDVPLMLGSFLSPPSTPSSPTAPSSYDSDGEGIPLSWSEPEDAYSGREDALSSSEDEASDGEGPSRLLDPAFRGGPRRRLRRLRISRDCSRSPQLPPLPMLEPLGMDSETPSVCSSPDTPSEYSVPETPSVYSSASPVEWDCQRQPPRESLVPADVPDEPYGSYHDKAPPSRSSSPFYPSHDDIPVLRSRFSTSTLASLPAQPSSSTQAFFARLKGRAKPISPTKSTSPYKGERSPPSSASPKSERALSLRRRRTHIVPASPAPSSFSFSSRASIDSVSADSCSCASDDSAGSAGLRRPPIPIELFLRG